jgi:hypothetical protein
LACAFDHASRREAGGVGHLDEPSEGDIAGDGPQGIWHRGNVIRTGNSKGRLSISLRRWPASKSARASQVHA